MARTADSQKIAQWRQRMARFERTQTSVTQFCRDEGVSVPAFYQWRKRLAPQSAPDDRATVAHCSWPYANLFEKQVGREAGVSAVAVRQQATVTSRVGRGAGAAAL